MSRWAIVARARKSYRVGISGPSRPDFPQYGYRFFQMRPFFTNTAGVSLQFSLLPNVAGKVKRNTVYLRNEFLVTPAVHSTVRPIASFFLSEIRVRI